jgi:serine protease Do
MKTVSPLLFASAVAVASLVGCASKSSTSSSSADVQSTMVTAKSLLETVKPSLVAVRYTFDGEMGRRDLEGTGIVVSSDGLVAFSSGLVPSLLPDAQIIDFRIVLPPNVEGPDEVELKATYLGRDERAELAFARVDDTTRTWKPLKPVDKPVEVGDTVHTVGLLSKNSGYAAYARTATVSARLRGPTPLILTSGDLTSVGSPAFNAAGEFIGIVPEFGGITPFLNPEDDTALLQASPMFVVPISDYLPTLNDPPAALNARKVPWLGVVQMTGLKKEVAEFYGLKGKVGVQVGDVIKGEAADKAGLKGGEIITQINGQDLERGDTPDELPMILSRKIGRMNVGEDVTLGIIRNKGDAAEPVTLTLQERPANASTAARFYAEDLGYTVRDMVFQDRYSRRLEEDAGGAVVTFVKPQGNAQAGGLQRNDVITKINQTDVTNVAQFKQAYEDFRKASPKESVVLEVLRGVDTQIVRIQPPQ